MGRALEEISFVIRIFEWRAGREVVWAVCHSGRSVFLPSSQSFLTLWVTRFQNSLCVVVILVCNVSVCERLENLYNSWWYFFMIVWWNTFPNAVTALSVILPSVMVFVSLCLFLSWCTRRDACSLIMSGGQFVENRLCPKLIIGKAKPLPLGNSLVLVTLGTQKNIMAREQSPFSERVPGFPWDVLDAQLSFSLTAPLTVYCVLSLVKVQLLHLQSPSHCSGISPRGGRREVWCRCGFSV